MNFLDNAVILFFAICGIVCAVNIAWRIVKSLISHWLTLFQIAFVILMTIAGGGHAGFTIAMMGIIALHFTRFVIRCVKRANKNKAGRKALSH